MIDEDNLKKYIISKKFKESLLHKYVSNIKLLDALEEYIYYSKNNKINKYFKNEIIKVNKLNKKINKLLDTINY